MAKKTLIIDGQETTFDDIRIERDTVTVELDGKSFEFAKTACGLRPVGRPPVRIQTAVDPRTGKTHIQMGAESHWVEEKDAVFGTAKPQESLDDRYEAPMPGKVVKILAVQGDRVKKGDPLIILEAMKMEHTIRAERDGVVQRIHCKCGEQVSIRSSLLELEG